MSRKRIRMKRIYQIKIEGTKRKDIIELCNSLLKHKILKNNKKISLNYEELRDYPADYEFSTKEIKKMYGLNDIKVIGEPKV